MIPQYKPLIDRQRLAKEVKNYILGDGYFMEYQHTKEFESQLASYLGVKYCSCVPNGTIALSLALISSGVKAGDYVLMPNITMMSTQTAIELIGATPLFIDLDPETLCLDIDQVMKEINRSTDKVSAVIYVTLNGRSHERDKYKKFNSFCIENKIALVEDNAQSFGSSWNNNDKISCPENGIGCFSLSVAKTITTGQGGFLVTNDDELGGRIKRIKDLGRENGGHDLHDEFGINAKFTEIQAIMGKQQLINIKEIVEKKKFIYDTYYNKLKNIKELKIFERKSDENIWFVDIYTPYREELIEFLEFNNIKSRKIYPPLTSQKVNKDYPESHLPISNEFGSSGLWLPSSLELDENNINDICEKISNFHVHCQVLKSNIQNNPNALLIDTCKGKNIYDSLKQYNNEIVEACEGFKFVSDRAYITENKEASWWFDPRCVSDLSISHVYPNNLPVQKDPSLSLTLYAPNYFALLLINILYGDNKTAKIEEQAGGMGKFFFYLNKLGFNNFHMVDNFSQLPQTLLDSLMNKSGIKYDLNNGDYVPDILNLIGYTHFVKEIRKETELVITYNNIRIITQDENGNLQYLLNESDSHMPLENKVCFAIDKYGLAKAYCNKDKIEEFKEKLKKYGE